MPRPGIAALHGADSCRDIGVACATDPVASRSLPLFLALMNPLFHNLRLLAGAAALAATAVAQDASVKWNRVALDAIRAASTAPPPASRHLACLHAAIHDAVNGITRRYEHYLVPPGVAGHANEVAAATTAGRDVLAAFYPTQVAKFDALNQSILARIPNGDSKNLGIAWGASVAKQTLSAREHDGANQTAPYPGSNDPGKWRPHVSFGGLVRQALLPLWGKVQTFGVPSGSHFRPPAPPALPTLQYAWELLEVQFWGGKHYSLRTPEQTQIAQFWSYGPGTATPPGHLNEMAQSVVAPQDGSLSDNARMFALLNIAMADAAIVSWDCKYEFALWRPLTAIQLADTDGNPFTQPDKTWEPLLETPPFPEYTSGHSTFSGAAAAVMVNLFGDRTFFELESDDLPGVVRYYHSFTQAAFESGISRVYGGIHYMSANMWGLWTGWLCGQHCCQNLLRPIKS